MVKLCFINKCNWKRTINELKQRHWKRRNGDIYLSLYHTVYTSYTRGEAVLMPHTHFLWKWKTNSWWYLHKGSTLRAQGRILSCSRDYPSSLHCVHASRGESELQFHRWSLLHINSECNEGTVCIIAKQAQQTVKSTAIWAARYYSKQKTGKY